MFDIVTLTIKFDEGELEGDDVFRFAALLLFTGLVYSTGTYGRFVNDLIEGGHTDAIAAHLATLRADPFAEAAS